MGGVRTQPFQFGNMLIWVYLGVSFFLQHDIIFLVGKNKTSERFLSHDMIGGKVFLIANYNNTTVPSVSVEVTTNIREKGKMLYMSM